MGCDIHTYIEYRKPTNKGPVWTPGDEYEPNKYFGHYPNEPEFCRINEVCGDRNYDLFAVLADVRNYGNITPLAQPKGLPADVCNSIKAEYIRWSFDAHSASYFTLAELMKALPDYPILQNLVNELQSRYKQLLPQDAPLITPNDLRFVFWFDN